MNKFWKNEQSEAEGRPALKPVLKGWIKALRDYEKATEGDYAWNYTERACIGFLAAGAWLSGGVALEEWRTEKLGIDVKAKNRNGRCDLWIYKRGQYDFHIEAKHMWSLATRSEEKLIPRINKALDRATDDARRLTCEDSDQKLGILFLAPFFPQGEQDCMNEGIASWLECITKVKHDAIGWVFSDRKTLPKRNGNIAPGLVVIVRAV